MQWIGLDLDRNQFGVLPYWPKLKGLGYLWTLQRSKAIDFPYGLIIVTANTEEEALVKTREAFREARRRGHPYKPEDNRFLIQLKTDTPPGSLQSMVLQMIDEAMREADGVQVVAAKSLGISERALCHHLKHEYLKHWKDDPEQENEEELC